MSTARESLEDRFKQLARIDHAMTFLGWDQMVMMPERGGEARADSMAELAGLHHALLTGPEMSDWFNEVATKEKEQAQDSGMREMRRVWQQATCLPADLVKAKIVAGSRCEHGWRTQRADNDWDGFLPNFREVVKISREEASLRQATGDFASPYDAMLDLHCAGDSTALIDSVFGRLREELPDMLPQVLERQKGRGSLDLSGDYPVGAQRELSQTLMGTLGFDFSEGRLDESMHPFSTGVKGDLRITTRYRNIDFIDALMSTAHETGHANYEGGLPEHSAGLPVGQHRNMCIHESQSLLFEKQLLLSRAFISHFTPSVHEALASTRQFDAETLWQVATRVERGFIRVEADEVTYPLHVLLRYEIEKSLVNGDLEPDDLPDAWNEKMQQYLGISTAGEFQNGCLQDIHWTDGAFGYFPSYTLGAVNGAQLFQTIRALHPDWQERLGRGDLQFVLDWLSKHIWQRGCELESQDLMQEATGEGTNPEHFLAHLRARYLDEAY